MAKKHPFIAVSNAGEGPAFWAARAYVPDDLRQAVRQASVVVIPQEGFRDVAKPLFPVGTEETVVFLRDRLPSPAALELPVADEEYEELALHADLIIIGAFCLTGIGAPLFVNLVTEVIKTRFPQFFGGPKTAEAKLELHVPRPDGTYVKVSYEGPAHLLQEQLTPVLEQVNSDEDLELLELDDDA